MLRLENPIQSYAWGSTTAIPKLLGQVPGTAPAAELWMGAHPRGPSVVSDAEGGTLLERITADPVGTLGRRVTERYGELPFLFKVLAAAHPLSLQAHPSKAQAVAGFAREEAAGIDRGAPDRNYRDPNHKPELLCALERFELLCGFRDPARSSAFIAALEVDALSPLVDQLSAPDEEQALRAAFGWTLAHGDDELKKLIGPVTAGLERMRWSTGIWRQPASWVFRLAASYPNDPGVLGALLLNDLVLEPGEAIYLGAGNLHAYLDGVGIELMANSDNVLRGGLTAKHVDPNELNAVLRFEALDAQPLRSVPRGEFERAFETPAEEFELAVIELEPDGALLHDAHGPEILLCTEGTCAVTAVSGGAVTLEPGQSIFCGPGVARLHAPTRALLFRASVPR